MTEHERKTIKLWLKEEKRTRVFYLLAERAKKNLSRLREDLELLGTFLESLEKQQ